MIDCHACNCLLKSCYGANIEIIRIRDKYFVIFFTIILIVKKRATQEETKRTLSMVGSMRLEYGCARRRRATFFVKQGEQTPPRLNGFYAVGGTAYAVGKVA